MNKLLSANLLRLFKSKVFLASALLMCACEAFFCLVVSLKQDSFPMDVVLYISLQLVIGLVSVFLSVFIGTEYSDGTIRNKLIVGHSRVNIYLANLITGVIAVTVIYLTEVLTGSIMGFLMYEPPYHSLSAIVLAGTVGYFACVAVTAVFTAVGMISSSKSTTAIINLLIAFGLMFFGLYTFNTLSGADSMSALKRSVYLFLFDANPYCQLLQTMSIEIASPLKLIAYSLMIFVVSSGVGMCIFQKKNLK